MGKREWFPRRLLPAVPGVSLVALWIFLLLSALGWSLALRLAVAAAWPLLVVAAFGACNDRGLAVSEDGLARRHWLKAAEPFAWADLRLIWQSRECLQLAAGDQLLRLDDQYRNHRRLIRLVEGRLSGDDGAEPVTANEIAALLGGDPDRGLVCTAPVRVLRLWPLALALAALLAGRVGSCGLIYWLTWRWATADQRHHWLRADGRGLWLRRGRHQCEVAWNEVTSLEIQAAPYSRFYAMPADYANDRLVRLHTDQGVVEWLYSDRQGRAMADAVERVLAAREAGRRLPERGLLNDASLSPARLTGTETERSLSLARE